MSQWVLQIPLLVFSRIKNRFPTDIKTKYGMTTSNFSDESTDNPPAFPFVFLHMLAPLEVGQTLDGESINGGNFTFQIEVYDNKKKSNALEVMSAVMDIMKSMRFEVVSMPEHFKTDNTHRYVARFRRIIGSLDVL